MSKEKRMGTIKGAIAAAFLGGGMGSSIATSNDFNRNWQAIPIGFGAGAIFGAVLGYATTPDHPQSSTPAQPQSTMAPMSSKTGISAPKDASVNVYP
jgi:hypothetical protein